MLIRSACRCRQRRAKTSPMRSDPNTISTTTVLVGSGRSSINLPTVARGSTIVGFRCFFRGSFTPNGRVLPNHFPDLSLIQMNTHAGVHQPDRLRRKPRMKRVEEILKFDNAHLTELHRSPGRQEVFVREKFVMLPSRILQMRPGLFATFCEERGQGFIVGDIETWLVIPRVYLLHELVSQALRVTFARRSLLAPNLGALPAGFRTVIPIHHFPLRAEVLYLASL